jgi:hypothetical protein
MLSSLCWMTRYTNWNMFLNREMQCSEACSVLQKQRHRVLNKGEKQPSWYKSGSSNKSEGQEERPGIFCTFWSKAPYRIAQVRIYLSISILKKKIKLSGTSVVQLYLRLCNNHCCVTPTNNCNLAFLKYILDFLCVVDNFKCFLNFRYLKN